MEYSLKEFKEVVTVTRLANIHYFEFSQRFHGKQESHPFCELVFIDSGSIIVHSDNYTGEMNKNQMIIHQANENHFLACSNEKPPNVIVIGFECACEELNQFSYAPTTLSATLISQLTEVIKEGNTVFMTPNNIPYIEDMQKRTVFPFGADQMIRLRLEVFLINLIRSRQHSSSFLNGVDGGSIHAKSEYLEEVRQYIDENFCRNIRLEELCILFNTNRTSLCNQFRDTYDITIIDYINKLRIRRAKVLIREEKLNITQIAAELGFSSVHYFSQTFKKYVNLTPTEYRATIKSRFEN